MILVYPDYELEFNFDIHQNYMLILENSKLFFKLSKMLYNQAKGLEGDFILSHKLKILNISKNIEFMFNFFEIDLNTKKVITEISNQALKILKENDFLQEFSIINEKINIINENIKEEIDLDLEYKYELSFEDFIKLSDFKISEDTSILSSIVIYLDFLKKIKKINLVIFVNIFDYFSKEEIDLLIKDLNYKEYHILFLESKEKYKVNAKRYIIDNDLCLI